jgi:cobalt-zinc-cadmium efflux system outer membrane protein
MRGVVPALMLCVAAALPAGAQTGRSPVQVPARLTLDEAIRIAEARSPALVSARTMTAMAEADLLGAGKRPNPSISIDSQGWPLSQQNRPPFFDNQELTIAVEQELEPGGRRGLRRQVAEAGVEISKAGVRDRIRLLRFDVRRAYLQAVLARADHDAARATLEEIDKVLAINRVRFEQGELSGIELRRLQVERHRFADDLLASELALKNTRSSLLSMLNLYPLDQEFDTADDLSASSADAGNGTIAPGQAPANRPDLDALRLAEQRAGGEAQLQHALRTPSFALGAGWQRDFGTNALVVSARIPLPLANRNEAGIARADAERRLAASRTEAVSAAAALEVQLAANSVANSRTRVERIEREYLKNAREARDIVLASYRAGAATLIDYLDAQRALREAQRAQNRAMYDYRVSVFALEAALGGAAPGV